MDGNSALSDEFVFDFLVFWLRLHVPMIVTEIFLLGLTETLPQFGAVFVYLNGSNDNMQLYMDRQVQHKRRSDTFHSLLQVAKTCSYSGSVVI